MEKTGTPMSSDTQRKAYAKPALLEYGSVAELTAITGAANSMDNPVIPSDMGSI